jgi:hypothetical protein
MSGHYGLLADLIGAVHALLVFFVVVGQALIMAGSLSGSRISPSSLSLSYKPGSADIAP